eukprot:GHVN01034632.1.p1 GENE.GHVN01034632.1~~GHVN01034632.1.p1  ORF type:complete len:657 (+),score=64.38 GHVN01034632.1:3741-5711(+)
MRVAELRDACDVYAHRAQDVYCNVRDTVSNVLVNMLPFGMRVHGTAVLGGETFDLTNRVQCQSFLDEFNSRILFTYRKEMIHIPIAKRSTGKIVKSEQSAISTASSTPHAAEGASVDGTGENEADESEESSSSAILSRLPAAPSFLIPERYKSGQVVSSDDGWGCMIRVGQMALAQCIVHCEIGRHWKRKRRSVDASQPLPRRRRSVQPVMLDPKRARKTDNKRAVLIDAQLRQVDIDSSCPEDQGSTGDRIYHDDEEIHTDFEEMFIADEVVDCGGNTDTEDVSWRLAGSTHPNQGRSPVNSRFPRFERFLPSFRRRLSNKPCGSESLVKNEGTTRELVGILNLFMDTPKSPFSLHNVVEYGRCSLNKSPSSWFGPTSCAQALTALMERNAEECYGLRPVMFPDSPIYMKTVRETVEQERHVPCRGVVIFLSLRLGPVRFNHVEYKKHLQELFKFPQFQGIAGGGPTSSAYFFVAANDENLFYLDPHCKVQKGFTEGLVNPSEELLSQFFPEVPRQLPWESLNASMTLVFSVQCLGGNLEDLEKLQSRLNDLDCSLLRPSDAEPPDYSQTDLAAQVLAMDEDELFSPNEESSLEPDSFASYGFESHKRLKSDGSDSSNDGDDEGEDELFNTAVVTEAKVTEEGEIDMEGLNNVSE